MHALSSGLSSGNPLAEAGRLASHPPPLISALKPQSGHRCWDGSLHFKVMASPSDQPRDLLSWGRGTRRRLCSLESRPKSRPTTKVKSLKSSCMEGLK